MTGRSALQECGSEAAKRRETFAGRLTIPVAVAPLGNVGDAGYHKLRRI
jgi:hypothetical protein